MTLLTTNLFSQKKIEYGIYLGSSIASLSGVEGLANLMSDTLSQTVGKDYPISETPRSFLFNGGGYVSYSFQNWLSLRAGMEYAPKGEKFKGECYLSTDFNLTSQVSVIESIIKVAYIEFPISVQLSTKSKTDPEKVYFYGNFGISPAVKVFSKFDVYASIVERGFDSQGTTEETLSRANSTNTLSGIKGFDFGMFFAGGVNYKHFFFETKYDRGLTNINKPPTDLDNKNTMISFVMGVKF